MSRLGAGLCRCDRGPDPKAHSKNWCPKWCSWAHQHATVVPYTAKATTLLPGDPEPDWWKTARPPRAPEQLKDPRRLTDGLDANARCICRPVETVTIGARMFAVDPHCPIHNMTIAQEDH